MTPNIAVFNERLQQARKNRGVKTGTTDDCFDRSLLSEIIAAFPQAPISITLRNVHFFGLAREVRVRVEGIGDNNTVGTYNVAPHEILPALKEWIHRNHKNGVVVVSRFIEDGQILATILERPLEIVHEDYKIKRNGSTSKKTVHGPFMPQRTQ